MDRAPALAAAVIAAALASPACNKQSKPGVAPLAGPAGPADPAGGPGDPAVAKGGDSAQRLQVRASVRELDDVLEGLKLAAAKINPDAPVDIKSELQATLLGMGFGPGFMSNLDLGGFHGLSLGYPPQGQGAGPMDTEVSGSLAVVSATKVIDNTPPNLRPQPLGNGMWEIRQNNVRVLLRDVGKDLLFGFSTADLDRATKLRRELGKGRRFEAKAWNLPIDDIDPSEILPLSGPARLLGDQVAKILRDTKQVEFGADFGTDRGLELVAGAEAPFHKLGIEPLGQARGSATALEGRLPADPVFVVTMSWGKPDLVHKLIDKQVPLGQIPPPFDGMATSAVENTHMVLDQLASDIVIAMYLDTKGQAALVLAADVRNDDTARKAMRGLSQVVHDAVDTQSRLVADRDARFVIDWKPDGLGFGSGKADKLAVTIPKSFREDARPAKMLLRKNTVEVVSFVRDKTAVVVLGAQARKIASDMHRSLGKKRKTSLAQHGGLATVRKALGGCQICVSGDPGQYARMRLFIMRDRNRDKATAKEIKTKLGKVGKIKTLGEPGAGVKVGRARASAGLTIPKSLIHGPSAEVSALVDLLKYIERPASQVMIAAEPPPPPAKKKRRPNKAPPPK